MTHSNQDPKLDAVPDLFAAKMKDRYSEAQLDNARALWADYVHKANPGPRKPGIYAASVEYLIAFVDNVAITQSALAKDYDTNVNSVSQVQRLIREALNLDQRDRRYSTRRGPAVRPERPLGQLDTRIVNAAFPLPIARNVQARLKRLRGSTRTWSIGVRPLPVRIESEGGGSPLIVLCVEEESGRILYQDLVMPPIEDLALKLFDGLQKAMAGASARPARVKVEEARVAKRLVIALRSVNVDVLCEHSAALDGLVQSLLGYMGAEPRDVSFLSSGCDPEAVAALFRAAARFARARLWERLDDAQIFSVDLDMWGYGRVCVSIIGAAGVSRGLLIFRSLDDCMTFRAVGIANKGMPDDWPELETLSLNLEPGADLSPAMRKEVRSHGWEVADDASYPLILEISAQREQRPLTSTACNAAMACADAIAAFAQQHPDFDQRPSPTSAVIALACTPELPSARVAFPHLDLIPSPAQPLKDTRLHRALARSLEDMNEEEFDALLNDLMVRFERSPEGKELADLGLSPQWSHTALEMASRYLGLSPMEVNENAIGALLFDLIPSKVSIFEDVTEGVIEELKRFWRFMGRAFGAPSSLSILALLNLRQTARRFDEAMNDPTSWGMVKSIMMMGHKAGFDVTTEQGVAQLMNAFNARMSGPSPLATPSPRPADASRGAGASSANNKKRQRKARRQNRPKKR